MIKPIFTTILLGSVCLSTACAEGDIPPVGTDYFERPEGFPFVTAVLSLSDLCEGTPSQSCKPATNPPAGASDISLSEPEPGTICMHGNVGDGGFANLIITFTEYVGIDNTNKIQVSKTLDADARGITQVSFDVETPPATGITVHSSILVATACDSPGFGCRAGGFDLTDPESHEAVEIDESQTVVAAFADFVQAYPEDLPTHYDTTKVDSLQLVIDEESTVDYCISNFKFLDAWGNEVVP